MGFHVKAAAVAACLIPMLGLSPHVAEATTVSVTSVTGTWSNVVGGTNVQITGVDPTTLSWGTGGTSSYVFDGSAPPPQGPYAPGSNFTLGTFTHNNEPINSGTSISGARLTLAINASINDNNVLTPISLTSQFDFSHNETPNGANPCANGQANNQGVNINGCADIVTALTNLGGSTSVTLDGIEYVFAFTGFLVNGNPLSQFFTVEDASNVASLQGSFIQKDLVNTVPLPAALPLFAGGLGCLGLLGRRKRRPISVAS